MHENLIMTLLATLKSHLFRLFSANSLAISSSPIVGERRRWLLYFIIAYSTTGPTIFARSQSSPLISLSMNLRIWRHHHIILSSLLMIILEGPVANICLSVPRISGVRVTVIHSHIHSSSNLHWKTSITPDRYMDTDKQTDGQSVKVVIELPVSNRNPRSKITSSSSPSLT